MRRVVQWGTENPWKMNLIPILCVALATGYGLQRQNDVSVKAVKVEAEARVAAQAEISVTICERAVRAVTAQSKADDLALIDAIKQRFAESGRPVPALYQTLEATISGRQAPIGACAQP